MEGENAQHVNILDVKKLIYSKILPEMKVCLHRLGKQYLVNL